MTEELKSRIAQLKASEPDPDNIRIKFLCNEPWRRNRLWKVMRYLSAEHAAEIAWMDDWDGQMRVGLRKGPAASRSLIDALVTGWHSQHEYLITLWTASECGFNGSKWCEIGIEDRKGRSRTPVWDVTLSLSHS
jgi:hypothetical protein